MNYIAIHTIWRGSPLACQARTAAAHIANVHENKVLDHLPPGGKVVEDLHVDVGWGCLVTYSYCYFVRKEGNECTT